MRFLRLVLPATFLGLLVVGLFLLSAYPGFYAPPTGQSGPATSRATLPALRLGLIPERDIYAQRRAYRVLADYLAVRLQRPVELVTTNSYEGILRDFAEGNIDAAFLGSLVGVLAHDRHGAQVLVRPEYSDGVSTYRGVLFVLQNSPIQSLEDLPKHSLGTVRTTTGGNLFPFYVLAQRKLLQSSERPRIVWCGTHDLVIQEVMAGKIDIGAVKDLRLDAYEKEHPGNRVRRLAVSEAVPENAFFVRGELDAGLGVRLREIFLQMASDPAARPALEALGMERFIPCRMDEYAAIYDMIDYLGGAWSELGIEGSAPRHLRSPLLSSPTP